MLKYLAPALCLLAAPALAQGASIKRLDSALDRMLASSTTRPLSAGNFGAAHAPPPKLAGAMRQKQARIAAKNRVIYGLVGCVPGCAAAADGAGAVLVAPGKLTTGADWAAALAAKGVACL